VAAGIYAETRLSPFGQPIESFILCPPKPIDITAWGLAPRGARLVEIEGAWHVFDIVSKADYHVADYVEETRRKGASRQLSSKPDFSKLSEDSRLILIHEKAIIENYHEYPQPSAVVCPLDIHLYTVHLSQLEEMCAGLWWHDIPLEDLQSPTSPSEIEGSEEDAKTDGILHHHRVIPGGVSYSAYPRPESVVPVYQHGIFMSLPITNLAVIAGRNTQENEKAGKAFQAASLSGLPVYMEDE
jgi:hypothetical protein